MPLQNEQASAVNIYGNFLFLIPIVCSTSWLLDLLARVVILKKDSTGLLRNSSILWLRSQIISRDQNTRDCFIGDLTLEMGVTTSDSIPVRGL